MKSFNEWSSLGKFLIFDKLMMEPWEDDNDYGEEGVQ